MRTNMNRFAIFKITKAGFAAGFAIFALIVTSCTTVETVELTDPPQIDSASAAIIKLRTRENLAPIQHSYVIRIDGNAYSKMIQNERFEVPVTAGSHKLRVTCHSKNTLNDNNFPVNYNVIDGEAVIDFEAVTSKEKCYKIGFALANCAVVTEAEPSYCN